MAYTFGAHSVAQIQTLHEHLRNICHRTLELHDFRVDIGARTPEAQQAAFEQGNSKVPAGGEYPHMIRPDGTSWAMDVTPFVKARVVPTIGPDWEKFGKAQFCRFLGIVHVIGIQYFKEVENRGMGKWELRFGVDWDGDGEILSDQTFQDYYHIELRKVA